MGLFDDIIPGNETRTPAFPEEVATYRVAIESSKYLDGTGPSGNKAFIVDLKVLESSSAKVEVGEFRSKYYSLNGNEFPGALKVQLKELLTFLVAATGFDPDTAAGVAAFRAAYPDIEKLYTKDAECLNGRELNLATTLKVKGPRAKTPGNVTLHAWTPAGEPAAPKADPYEGMPRDESGTLAWNGTAWIVMATGQAA